MSSIIARQPLPSPTQPHILVDLVALLEAAVPQVCGSDERAALENFLLRNTEPQQIVCVPANCLRTTQCLRANTAPRWAELRGGNVLRAAQQLATSNCGTKPEVHAAITPDLLASIRLADDANAAIPLSEANSNQLDECQFFRKQFEQIRAWYLACDHSQTNAEDLANNIATLQQLRETIRPLPSSNPKSILATLLISLQSKLETLRDQYPIPNTQYPIPNTLEQS